MVKNHVTHGGTRTPNLRFRRPTPYPLGHAGNLHSTSIIHLGLEMAGSWRQKVLTVIVQRIFSELSLSARLAQSVEHETLNLRVVGSSPTLGAKIFCILAKIFSKNCWQKCRDPGSNRGPLDLQSNALPTELSRLVILISISNRKLKS